MKFLGLDVGEKRIGVAKADSSVKIAVPQAPVFVDGFEINNIQKLVKLGDIDVIVIGMPRNLNGEKTAQSLVIKDFVKRLNKALVETKPNNKTVRILFQDESLTSVEAESRLKKKGTIDKKSGAVDSEAASIILQDFLENLSRRISEKRSTTAPVSEVSKSPTPSGPETEKKESKKPNKKSKTSPQFEPYGKTQMKKWLAVRIIIIVLLVFGLGFLGVKIWYNTSLAPVVANSDDTELVDVSVPDGATVEEIASLLKSSGLIKSSLAFRIYTKLSNSAPELKSGSYKFSPSSSVEEIVASLKQGSTDALVFRFTSLPGETIMDIKSRLKNVGYSEEEIEEAFSKEYNHPILSDKPAGASLEGYLFGETYEFYRSDSVETIIYRMLDELYTVVEKNNLRSKFNAIGLTLHQGIILASIVQKEAGTLTKDDQSIVAGVFLNRLDLGMSLGSDVTVSYAVELVDPNRETYTDNASAIEIDSCYNTRKNVGLPCGPISNPGALSLLATASPTDTSYLYFLTGDDGMMYYSNTESEHIQKIRTHCLELCNVQL